MDIKKNNVKICVVGAGNIGSAMARGLAKSGVDVSVYNRSAGRLKAFDGMDGISCTTSLADALNGCGIVLICVEGDAVVPVAREIASLYGDRKPIVGSCAAAIALDELKASLVDAHGDTPQVFRLLPNIAATVGQSANLLCGSGLSSDMLDKLKELFACTGATVEVPERLFPAAMALSSCGIAYALRYVRANMLAGVQMGLSPEVAKELASAVLCGTSALLDAGDVHPEALIDRVTTPGGVTIRGLNAMENGGFSASVVSGLLATLK